MIKLLPIDYCGTIDELSKWHDEWSCEVFGSIDPSRYYKQSGEGGRYLYGVAEDMSLNEEKATRERVLELLLRIRSINQKLSGMSISQHLQYEEREQMKMERKTLYDEYLELVRPEPEPQQEKSELPDALNTERARLIFGGAIAKGWMLPNYEWVGLGVRGQRQQLCYMLGEVYGYKKGQSGNDGASIPSTEIGKFFKIEGFYSRLIKCWECKPQSWRTPIDEMIKEVTKST